MFAFKLAGHLKKTVRQLLNEMDSEELSEWMAYDQIHPLPDPYWIGAAISKTIADCTPELKRKPKLEDFLPITRSKPKKRQSAGEHLAILDAMFAAQKPT